MLDQVDNFLSQRTWAVVGASNNPAKYGYKVYQRLKTIGYSVYAINPGLDTINGDQCYHSLSSLPVTPDAVSIIVPPKITEQVILNCIDLNINKVWMQPGSQSDAAICLCRDHDITAIHDQCILIQTRSKVK